MPSSAWRSTLFPYTTLFRSDRKSTRLNSSHDQISYAVFCLKKKRACISFLRQRPRRMELPEPTPGAARPRQAVFSFDEVEGYFHDLGTKRRLADLPVRHEVP